MTIAGATFPVPFSDSSLRRETLPAAIFNMIATIIGGGVLSSPLSCAHAKLVPSTALVVVSPAMMDFSLYIMRCNSFGRVAGTGVGAPFKLFLTANVFVLVSFVIVGLMVLNRV